MNQNEIIEKAVTQMSGVTMASHEDFERELRAVLEGALKAQLTAVREIVEGMYKSSDDALMPDRDNDRENHGYNQAVYDILEALQG